RIAPWFGRRLGPGLRQLGSRTLEIAHRGEQPGRLGEPARRLVRGLSGHLEGSLQLARDLPGGLEILLAHLLETFQAPVERAHHLPDRARLDAQLLPAFGFVPTLERLAQGRELISRQPEIVDRARGLA